MKIYHSSAETCDVIAPVGGVVGDIPFAVGSLAGITTRDAAAGEVVPILVRGVVRMTHGAAAGAPVWITIATQALALAGGAGTTFLGTCLIVDNGVEAIAVGVGHPTA